LPVLEIQRDPSYKRGMKAMTPIFWLAVAGVCVSICGGVLTAVHQHQVAKAEAERPITIPTPAMPSH
jgi:hypothetical protein